MIAANCKLRYFLPLRPPMFVHHWTYDSEAGLVLVHDETGKVLNTVALPSAKVQVRLDSGEWLEVLEPPL